MSSFFHELKRRNVYKVGAAHAVVAWLPVQAASILLSTFETPGRVMKVFVALVASLLLQLASIVFPAFEAPPWIMAK